MRKRKYFFGKVNLFGEYVDNRQEQLWEALESTAAVPSSDKYLWGFVDTERLPLGPNEEYFVGKLVKFTDETEKTVDRERHRTREVLISDRIVAESRFILHASSGVVAYHRDGSQIKPDMFRKYFGKAVVTHFQGFFLDCEVRVVGDFEEFEKRIRRFTRLEKLKLEVHVANPGRKAYAGIEEELRQLNAHTKKLGYEAQSNQSLNIDDAEDLFAYMEMVADGYGEASATGEHEGRYEEVSSEDEQDAMYAPADAPVEGIFAALSEKFQEIRDRLGY